METDYKRGLIDFRGELIAEWTTEGDTPGYMKFLGAGTCYEEAFKKIYVAK